MKIERIKYGMLRVTGRYENDRMEVDIAIEPDDKLGDVIREAKAICKAGLGADTATITRCATFDEILADERRRGL